MWKNKAITMLSAVLCASMLALGVSADGYFASDENGTAAPPDAIDSITVSTEEVGTDISRPEIEWDEDAEEITGEIGDFMSGFLDLFGGTALTPNGNLTLVDDILQDESYYVSGEKVVQDKQFITVQSKNGNYFYIVIDRSGDKENVYFLNMVDEADLMALIETDSEETEEETEPPKICECKDKCTAGEVDTDCPVCTLKMTDCKGKEVVVTPAEPVEEPEKKSDSNAIVLLLILGLTGGGAVYYFKFRKPKEDVRGNTDPDDYPYPEEDDNLDDVEYETEKDSGA
ncbi:MAG: DUF4366 domain-containing protein [Clostridia bacterium]|nr:DUF4366 domain-containing protein [Clostridia bacterium]